MATDIDLHAVGAVKIKSVEFEEAYAESVLPTLPGVPPPLRVVATFENGAVGVLFRFYSDELTFTADEFVGLTAREAVALWTRKDTEYLRS